MTDRGQQLYATVDRQIAELIGLMSTAGAVTLRRPCAGRENLGDGTVAACARHTADNYERTAAFVQDTSRRSAAHEPHRERAHRIPRLVRALGRAPAEHAVPGPRAGQHDAPYTADDADVDAIVDQLQASRAGLGRIAELTASQLDAIPPKDGFRFCDGQRTLEQVLAGLAKHQGHQVDALRAATG